MTAINRSAQRSRVTQGVKLALAWLTIMGMQVFVLADKMKSPLNAGPEMARLIRGFAGAFPSSSFDKYVGDQAAINSALQMLHSQDEVPYWPNAMLVLGYISPYNSGLVQVLADFIEDDRDFPECSYSDGQYSCRKAVPSNKGIFSDSSCRARLNSLLAIGDLLRKSRAAKCQGQCAGSKILLSGSDPSFWAKRIKWDGECSYSSETERNEDLAAASIRGLGLSCRHDAVKRLDELSRKPDLSPPLKDALSEALVSCPVIPLKPDWGTLRGPRLAKNR